MKCKMSNQYLRVDSVPNDKMMICPFCKREVKIRIGDGGYEGYDKTATYPFHKIKR